MLLTLCAAEVQRARRAGATDSSHKVSGSGRQLPKWQQKEGHSPPRYARCASEHSAACTVSAVSVNHGGHGGRQLGGLHLADGPLQHRLELLQCRHRAFDGAGRIVAQAALQNADILLWHSRILQEGGKVRLRMHIAEQLNLMGTMQARGRVS